MKTGLSLDFEKSTLYYIPVGFTFHSSDQKPSIGTQVYQEQQSAWSSLLKVLVLSKIRATDLTETQIQNSVPWL